MKSNNAERSNQGAKGLCLPDGDFWMIGHHDQQFPQERLAWLEDRR